MRLRVPCRFENRWCLARKKPGESWREEFPPIKMVDVHSSAVFAFAVTASVLQINKYVTAMIKSTENG